MNRNHWITAGTVVLLLGIVLNNVRSITLHEEATKIVAAQMEDESTASMGMWGSTAGVKKTIEPPQWLRFALMAAGAVLIGHAIAMKKPGG